MSDVQNLFRREKEAWLESARAAAKKLLKEKSRITVEDVLEIVPRPSYVHRNATGNIFQDKDFVAVGWRPSKRVSMNGRQVRVWTLRKPPTLRA